MTTGAAASAKRPAGERPRKLAGHSHLPRYELLATLLTVPTYTDTPRIVYLVLLIAYARSMWNSVANGLLMDPLV